MIGEAIVRLVVEKAAKVIVAEAGVVAGIEDKIVPAIIDFLGGHKMLFGILSAEKQEQLGVVKKLLCFGF